MTTFQIEVRAVSEQHDVQAQQLAREIKHLPFKHLPSVAPITASTTPLTIRTAHLYRLSGNLTPTQVDQLIEQLLVDPIVQEASYSHPQSTVTPMHIVDVFFHPGVTDTLAESVVAGAQMLGISGLEHVETGKRYKLDSRLSKDEVRIITEALLYNPVIQEYLLQAAGKTALHHPPQHNHPPQPSVEADLSRPSPIYRPPISNMSDQQLLELSKNGLLSLNLDEMQVIQQHYRELGREPTDIELETLAQTWSEHCSHKTFKATIHYREQDPDGNILEKETISGLLKQYIMRATEQINQPWIVSAFSDNAGIIRFTPSQDIAFKVETHNHPSAIEPFGGANTGVGGVIRDVLGVSAQPIACTDILCFGSPETPAGELPAGLLSPRRIASGVVNGIRDYGNKIGIPTVNGAILYHDGYLYNPLVFCGCLGILPHGSHPRQVQAGDLIVVLGGRTGRDGIHGATFSSGEMSREINAQAGSAVQIGAPITEKKVADVIIQARDRQLYHAITDCGAGGFSSAIGEMGAETGAQVELAHAPLKYQGLAPWEIWLSEAQERMVLAVPPEHLDELLEICAIEEVEASVIGTFTDNHRLIVTYHGQVVADIDMHFLHDGRPDRVLEAVWVGSTTNGGSVSPPHPTPGQGQALPLPYTMRVDFPHQSEAARPRPYMVGIGLAPILGRGGAWLSPIGGGTDADTLPLSFPTTLLTLLRHPTIASKESVVRRYDHEVQGATVLKPLVGRAGNGPGDASVLQPILEEQTSAGIVLSNGINPLYGKIDPYAMAMNAVDEALRNLTAVGGDLERAAILDNFCWGNPTDPVQLGMLVRAVKGCHDAVIGFGTPFISGKDSLNNEYRADGERLPVIPTLLISAVGVIDNASQTIDMSLKQPDNLLYQVGITRNELAGSHYAEITWLPFPNTTVPHVDIPYAHNLMRALGSAIREGLVEACHDLSEGGLAIAAAEMSLAGMLGMTIDMGKVPLETIPTLSHTDADSVHSRGDPLWSPWAGSRPMSHTDADSVHGRGIVSGGHSPWLASRPDYNSILLFSESASRFLVEIAPEQRDAFETYLHNHKVQDFACIGTVTGEAERFVVQNGDETLIDIPIAKLQAAWKGEMA